MLEAEGRFPQERKEQLREGDTVYFVCLEKAGTTREQLTTKKATVEKAIAIPEIGTTMVFPRLAVWPDANTKPGRDDVKGIQRQTLFTLNELRQIYEKNGLPPMEDGTLEIDDMVTHANEPLSELLSREVAKRVVKKY